MTSADRLPPTLSDEYEVVRELGRGGMATVYLARDTKHGRDVAVKVLHPELVAAADTDRFAREIRIAATLQHPNILPLFASGRSEQSVYYVMPYVAGESLRDRIQRERQLPIGEAIRIARGVAEALGYAHERQVVHRDIKPENILLSGQNVYVADFGVARALGVTDGGLRTKTGIAVGTPHYMSPEQATADTSLDGRSDVYALGCVLYEMLAGEPPFSGPSLAAVIARHIQADVPRVTIVRPTVPLAVQEIIETAMHKSPADRFQTAGEFVRALDDAAGAGRPASPLGGAGRGARGPTLVARWAPGSRARRVVVGGIVVLGLAVSGWWLTSRGAANAVDPNLVFVAPFRVPGELTEEWRDDLVTLVARNLDGAGPLRAVDPTRVLSAWTNTTASAAALSFGAGLSVAGTVTRTGGDSIRIRATVTDELRGESFPEFDVYGPATRRDQVSDSLSLALLRLIAPARQMGPVQLVSLRASLPAIKAFLRGELLYRQSVFDSAKYYFRRATELDSTFALALQRLYLMNHLGGAGADTLTDHYALRAGQLNRGLAVRESLLVAIDSLSASAGVGSSFDDTTHSILTRRVLASLETATQLFPGDAEVWFRFGDALLRTGSVVLDLPRGLVAVERAIALDSIFAPAYPMAIELATRVGNEPLARQRIASYLRLNPRGVDADGIRLANALLELKAPSHESIRRLLEGVPATVAFSAQGVVFWRPDSAELALHVARHIDRDPKGGGELKGRNWARSVLHSALGWRGHIEEAFRFNPGRGFPTLLAHVLPLSSDSIGDQAAALAAPLLTEALLPQNDLPLLFPFWYERGDTLSLRVAGQRADSLARSGSSPRARLYGRYLAAAAAAYVALSRRDSALALTRFSAIPDSVCALCEYEGLVRARLLRSRARNADAQAILARGLVHDGTALMVLWRLERARAARDAGDRATAEREYRFVAAIWRHADSALQPMVGEARDYLGQADRR